VSMARSASLRRKAIVAVGQYDDTRFSTSIRVLFF
jgi:hypothetical protein